MKAVMYGAGNIGRGFIAQLFNLSGYETVFVDVNKDVVRMLNEDGKYPLFITDKGDYIKTEVDRVRCADGTDIALVAEEISTADIMATAVGVNVLKFIAKPIAEGVRARMKKGNGPLDIIVCENKIDANVYLHDLIAENLNDEEKAYFDANFGFVEASIGRMVPKTPENISAEYPLAVCVEKFCTLPVDRDAFKGEIPEIKNMLPYAPFELFIQRKLYMHNMSHALCAYLGNLKGAEYIWQAAQDMRIRFVALGALTQSAQSLAKHHGANVADLNEHSFDLLSRYDNKLLGDTVARVGNDTKRKLSSVDRLPGAIKLAKSQGLPYDYMVMGMAAGLLFDLDDSSKEVSAFAAEKGVAEALKVYSEIEDSEIVSLCESFYNALKVDVDSALDMLIHRD
ncbi:MAG: mannitol dehydrogenase [Ruminococcaceae bacterium]|nr:mannitol dehydrogenase [Oscillospiraceae bacterium]